MLTDRSAAILKSIIGKYIVSGIPVASQNVIGDHQLAVSSATIRNEMARLEQGGYISRAHPSAGSVPMEKGYRYYVESLSAVELPMSDQVLINHLFHQVEGEMEKLLRLSATVVAQLVRNAALVTTPKPADCRLKHVEMVALQDTLALLVAVFYAARVKQEIVTLGQVVSQPELDAAASKLNAAYAGLTRQRISAKNMQLAPLEQKISDCLLNLMRGEDEQEYDEPYLEGWHYMLNQPEFASSHRMLTLMELAEQRQLLRTMLSQLPKGRGVRVVIGHENKAEAIHDFSIVISQYGLPDEVTGTIGVIGPTRMSYERAISTVGYVSSVLSALVAEIYGKGRNN